MRVAYFGRGSVGAACGLVLTKLGIVPLSPLEYHTADIWVSVHWDRLFTAEQLHIPKLGILNLHNSYLPWNKGAHPCTWAIIDQTPHGVTCHWLDEGVDTGDIYHQRKLDILEGETAHQLYQRTVHLEAEVFTESMTRILAGDRTRTPQKGNGSFHRKKEFDRLVLALTTSDCHVVRA